MRYFICETPQTGSKLIHMGFVHGKNFDCNNEDCQVCKIWRERDKEEVMAMSDEEKMSLSWGRVK